MLKQPQIEHFQRFCLSAQRFDLIYASEQSIYQKTKVEILERAEQMGSNSRTALTQFGYRDPISERFIHLDTTHDTLKNELKLLEVGNNKKLSWLLVDLYEEFLDFVKSHYVYSLELNPNLWPIVECETRELDEVKSTEIFTLKRKGDTNPKGLSKQLEKVINCLHEKNPNMENLQKIGLCNVSEFKFYAFFIQTLINSICHDSGIVKTPINKYIKRIIDKDKEASESQKKEHEKFAKSYFREINGTWHIYMQDISLYDPAEGSRTVTRYPLLLDRLLSYSHILCQHT